MYFYDTNLLRRIGELTEIPFAVYSLDFANESSHIALGCGDGVIRIFECSLFRQDSDETGF